MRFKWPHEAAHVGDGTSLMRGQLGEGRNRKTWEKMRGRRTSSVRSRTCKRRVNFHAGSLGASFFR